MAYSVSNMADLLKMLESNKPEVVQEIKQAISEQYEDVKEPWLVNGLYDTYYQTGSAGCLQLLLAVRDPHERFLMDKICEGLKQQDKPRLNGLTVLGYVIRKQPSWLYKFPQHNAMKELLKILKHEDDIVIMMTALLDLLALMPIVPVQISKYLPEIFEVFSRFASWRYQCIKSLPEIQRLHLQIGLYGFFHRLYGMFPCNFLSYLRQHYSENNQTNYPVFTHTIRPLLSSVTMHPLLVTHSRDQEKSDVRWKKMELHDIIIESSRCSLLSEESSKEGDNLDALNIDISSHQSKSADIGSLDPHGLYGSATRDPLWTPSRKCDFATPPPATGEPVSNFPATLPTTLITGNDNSVFPSPNFSNQRRQIQDSPPEAAIEATPETTPFVTPVKQDEKFKFARPAPTSQVSRHLKLDVGTLRSPVRLSPNKDSSPFRFPEPVHHFSSQCYERRDSLFVENVSFVPKLMSLTSSMPTGSEPALKDSSSMNVSTQVESTLAGEFPTKKSMAILSTQCDGRPSPIKFTSQRPKQFPIQPKPERVPQAVTDAVKHKMLSLDNLKDALPDFGKEEDDDEVTEITGGSDNRHSDLSTRHITPQMIYVNSAATSRTVSRLSSSSQVDDARKSEGSLPPSRPNTSTVDDIAATKVASILSPEASSDCKVGGLHPPSREAVSGFLRHMSGRIRYASFCGPPPNTRHLTSLSGMSSDIEAEIESVMSSGCNFKNADQTEIGIRRSSSCPDVFQMVRGLQKKSKFEVPDGSSSIASPMEIKSQEKVEAKLHGVDKGLQTDPFLVYPYDHLFPSLLPTWFMCHDTSQAKNVEEDAKGISENNSSAKTENPYQILNQYIRAVASLAEEESMETDKKLLAKDIDVQILKEEVALLHSQLLFEQHRREVLGVRNRRLLGKTRSSRILEEQNTALTDQFHIVQSEIQMLYSELETLRKQKHHVEEERAENDKQRDKQIEEFMSENKTLKQEKIDLEVKCNEHQEKINSFREEIQRLQAALFRSESENERYKKKDESRLKCEEQLFHLRKEVLLLGELLQKYREKESFNSRYTCVPDAVHYSSAKEQISVLQSDLQTKTSENEALKARIQELEQTVAKKDQSIKDQKNLLKKVKEEYEENLNHCEHSYNVLLRVQSQLEGRILELQDQLAKTSRIGGRHGYRSTSPSVDFRSRASAMSGTSRSVVQSACVDIGRPQTVSSSGSGGNDRTFTVGSPPSSDGSFGSDRCDLIQRSLQAGLPILGSRSPSEADPRGINGDSRK